MTVPDAAVTLFETLACVAEEDILECNLLQVDAVDLEPVAGQRLDDLRQQQSSRVQVDHDPVLDFSYLADFAELVEKVLRDRWAVADCQFEYFSALLSILQLF